MRRTGGSGRRASRDVRVTLEYTPLAGVNDTPAAAAALIEWVRTVGPQWLHVNLIPFNPWQGAPHSATPLSGVHAFQSLLSEGGVRSTIRQPRGRDIMAACGQLQSAVNGGGGALG